MSEQITIGTLSVSPQFGEISAALSRAVGRVEAIPAMAGLVGLLEALRPALVAEEVVLLQPFDAIGPEVRVTTMIVKGEQWMSNTIQVSATSSHPGAVEAALSQARRCGLLSLLGLPTNDFGDDPAGLTRKVGYTTDRTLARIREADGAQIANIRILAPQMYEGDALGIVLQACEARAKSLEGGGT